MYSHHQKQASVHEPWRTELSIQVQPAVRSCGLRAHACHVSCTVCACPTASEPSKAGGAVCTLIRCPVVCNDVSRRLQWQQSRAMMAAVACSKRAVQGHLQAVYRAGDSLEPRVSPSHQERCIAVSARVFWSVRRALPGHRGHVRDHKTRARGRKDTGVHARHSCT